MSRTLEGQQMWLLSSFELQMTSPQPLPSLLMASENRAWGVKVRQGPLTTWDRKLKEKRNRLCKYRRKKIWKLKKIG